MIVRDAELMASSSLLLRSICRKGFVPSSSNCSFRRKWRVESSCSNLFKSVITRLYSSSPCLMLPPLIEGVNNSTVSFKFYSLSEDKVITLEQKDLKELMTKPNRRLRFRGSSHGWLALINPHNLDLFLYNPISRRHIKLPPIHDFPNYPNEYVTSRDVDKLILSCSPDEDEENCRALMIYNRGLAFCCPGSSNEWTLLGDMSWWYEGRIPNGVRRYTDCVYSTKEKVFFCLTRCESEVESWDLEDPSSPRMIKTMEVDIEHYRNNYKYASLRNHLVVAAEQQDLFVVTQYAAEHVRPDGSYADSEEGWDKYPHMTKDFDVQKYDPEEGAFKQVDSSSLGGLALFVGLASDSVALPAVTTQFNYLKPNSIYFTDPFGSEALHDYDFGGTFWNHDIGIFNYEDKTVSSCYYPCDVQSLKKIVPPPMWFFPSRPI